MRRQIDYLYPKLEQRLLICCRAHVALCWFVSKDWSVLCKSSTQLAGSSLRWTYPIRTTLGQREALEEMLRNLVDNACKWAKSTVKIKSVAEDHSVLLTVDDDGPGILASIRDQMPQRGVRADESTPGLVWQSFKISPSSAKGPSRWMHRRWSACALFSAYPTK